MFLLLYLFILWSFLISILFFSCNCKEAKCVLVKKVIIYRNQNNKGVHEKMSKNLFVQDDFVIEGFDPDKLSELKKKASSGNGWQEIMGAYQNQKILKGRVRGIQEVGSAKKTCAMVMVKDIQGIIPIEFFGVENKRQLRNYVGDEVVFRVVEYDRKNEESFVGSRIEARNQMAEITLRRVSE